MQAGFVGSEARFGQGKERRAKGARYDKDHHHDALNRPKMRSPKEIG